MNSRSVGVANMFKFIEKLQNSDEDVKRRWMVILTVIAMVIVIYVWLAYFNNLIADLSRPPEQEFAAGESTSGFTFWQSAKNGLGLVYNGFIGKLRWLGEVLGEPREYIIPPQ